MIVTRGGRQLMAGPTVNFSKSTSFGPAVGGQDFTGAAIFDTRGLVSTGLANDERLSKFTDDPQIVEPFCWLFGNLVSTAADKQISITMKLHHGDSSGGGDMAELLPPNTAVARTYFSTAQSTDSSNWTTGVISLASNWTAFEISNCKRFIKPVANITRNVAVSSSGQDTLTLAMGLDFREYVYSAPGTGGVGSTYVTTSTVA